MMKTTVFALLGLAAVLALANPPRANAGVVIGVGIGPVFPRPAYGYVVAPPRPYVYYAHPYARPYAYAPGYTYPPYVAYGHFDRDWRWDHRGWDHRDRDDRWGHGFRR